MMLGTWWPVWVLGWVWAWFFPGPMGSSPESVCLLEANNVPGVPEVELIDAYRGRAGRCEAWV